MNVSVALCTYNGEAFLEEQLISILNQSYEISDIVVYDDNSSDSSVEILNRFQRQYPDTFEVHVNNTNLGVNRNFSRCINDCEGDVIAISDQDDVWCEDKVKRQVEEIKEPGRSLVFHNSTVTTEDLNPVGDIWDQLEFNSGDLSNRRESLRILLRENYVQGSTIMFDSELKQYIHPIPEYWPYDYFIAVIALVFGNIYAIDEELMMYRQHSGQEIGSPNDTPFSEILRNSLSVDKQEQHQYISSRWENTHKRLLEMNKFHSDPFLKWSLKMVEEKIKYEENKSDIYDHNILLYHRIRLITDNILNGRYRKFANQNTIQPLIDFVYTIMKSRLFK